MKETNALNDDMLDQVTGGVMPSAGAGSILNDTDKAKRPNASRPASNIQMLPFICPYCKGSITIPALNEVKCPACGKAIHISG